MRTTNRLFGVGVAVLLLACALAGCSKGPDDDTLAQNVKAKISADPKLGPQAISVTAKDGVVTLSGTVSTDADKSSAESLAKSVDGVKSVTNSLTTKPVINATPPPVSEDTKLKSDVEAALTKYGITGVTVAVAGGEVTLSGDIPRAKLQDAMKAANESHPKKVVNKMNIK
ncbi:MAG TPA: BON domain-containing protein [Pyrinomonadaceae bacterium]|nr:BON domain-containing protein [Pyrinomonadaceae bacterium]